MTHKHNNNSSNQRNPSNYEAYKGTDRVICSQTSPEKANENFNSSSYKGKQPAAKRVHLDPSQQSTSKVPKPAALTSQQLDKQEVAKTYGQANASAPPPQDTSQLKMLAVTVILRYSVVCNRLQPIYIKKQKL
jgi:hypothetical protein